MDNYVMVVDDEQEDISILSYYLKRHGVLRITHFFCGEAAVRFLRTTGELPTLILTDMNMSPLGGVELKKEIKRNPALKDIPLRIMTGSPLSEEPRADLCKGGDTFVADLRMLVDRFVL